MLPTHGRRRAARCVLCVCMQVGCGWGEHAAAGKWGGDAAAVAAGGCGWWVRRRGARVGWVCGWGRVLAGGLHTYISARTHVGVISGAAPCSPTWRALLATNNNAKGGSGSLQSLATARARPHTYCEQARRARGATSGGCRGIRGRRVGAAARQSGARQGVGELKTRERAHGAHRQKGGGGRKRGGARLQAENNTAAARGCGRGQGGVASAGGGDVPQAREPRAAG